MRYEGVKLFTFRTVKPSFQIKPFLGSLIHWAEQKALWLCGLGPGEQGCLSTQGEGAPQFFPDQESNGPTSLNLAEDPGALGFDFELKYKYLLKTYLKVFCRLCWP